MLIKQNDIDADGSTNHVTMKYFKYFLYYSFYFISCDTSSSLYYANRNPRKWKGKQNVEDFVSKMMWVCKDEYSSVNSTQNLMTNLNKF